MIVAVVSNVSTLANNGIKFNGHNYDDWIEYVKLNAGILGLDSALYVDEPDVPIDTSTDAERQLWENWDRSSRLMMSFLIIVLPDMCIKFSE